MKGIRTELPTIEKGIPCPFKTHPSKYKKKPSMWHEFLQKLTPGDSFLVMEREIQNLTHIARQVQVMVVVRHGPSPELNIPEDHSRVWLAPPVTEATEEKRGVRVKKATTKKPAMLVDAIADASDLSLI